MIYFLSIIAHGLYNGNNLTALLITKKVGWYKKANIAALQQAKFYPHRQAAAATAGSTSCTAAATNLNEALPQYTSWNL